MSSEQYSLAMNKTRARVRELMELKKEPKILKHGKELLAAAYIGKMISKLTATGMSITKIVEDITAKPNGPAKDNNPFRIYRWMLKGNAVEVTDELRRYYIENPKILPQRTTSTYLRLVASVAEIAQADPLSAQEEFLREIDELNSVATSEDIQPENELAAALNRHAASVAARLDLPRLFQRCQQAQPRMNLQNGALCPNHLNHGAIADFSHTRPLDHFGWLETAGPAVPTVKIARIPFGILQGPFNLSQGDELREVRGEATAYWDVHLAIAPTGPLNLRCWLLRSSSVDVCIEGRTMTLANMQDDIEQICSQFPSPAVVEFRGRTWTLTCQNSPVYSDYFNGPNEEPPSNSIPYLRIDPLNGRSIVKWLMTSASLSMGTDLLAEVEDLFAIPEARPAASAWAQSRCVASSLEAAWRDGRLMRAFMAWDKHYRPQIDALHDNWLTACRAETEALHNQSFSDLQQE